MKIEVHGESRPKVGESVCGDGFFIRSEATTMLLVVDGLGHGPHAAEAAQRAIQAAAGTRDGDNPVDILREASQQMVGTRGAVAMVATLTDGYRRLSIAGVGNIDLRAVSLNPIHPISSPGILGRRIRMIRQYDYDLHAGDLLIMVSDGVSRRMDLETLVSLPVEEIVHQVLERYGQSHDDATCLAMRVG